MTLPPTNPISGRYSGPVPVTEMTTPTPSPSGETWTEQDERELQRHASVESFNVMGVTPRFASQAAREILRLRTVLADYESRMEAEAERLRAENESHRVILAGWRACGEENDAEIDSLRSSLSEKEAEIERLRAKADAYDRVNTPELYEFVSATENEALHQREKWARNGDEGKSDADWFWLIGYLAGKALHNPAKDGMPDRDARLHRIVTIAAAAANWHAATLGTYCAMRPGSPIPSAEPSADLTTVVDAALSHAEYECSDHDHAVKVKAAAARLTRPEQEKASGE